MKTGVSTASLFLRKYNEDALPLLDSLGVKHAEVFLTTYSEYGKEFAQILSSRKGNITVNSVHSLVTDFEPQLFNAHDRARKDAFSRLEKVMESAQILRAPYYTFHGTARVKKASRSGALDNFPKMIENMQAVSDFCNARGVTLCLENVEWALYNRIGVFETLSSNIPNLKGVLDIKQARISEIPYENYLREMGSRLAYAHISGLDEKGKICLPHKGKFDFETLVKRLKDVGFDGALLIEVYTGDYGDETELKTACDYMDEILYKNGVLSS